jgi:uncharacterized protein YceK
MAILVLKVICKLHACSSVLESFKPTYPAILHTIFRITMIIVILLLHRDLRYMAILVLKVICKLHACSSVLESFRPTYAAILRTIFRTNIGYCNNDHSDPIAPPGSRYIAILVLKVICKLHTCPSVLESFRYTLEYYTQ